MQCTLHVSIVLTKMIMVYNGNCRFDTRSCGWQCHRTLIEPVPLSGMVAWLWYQTVVNSSIQWFQLWPIFFPCLPATPYGGVNITYCSKHTAIEGQITWFGFPGKPQTISQSLCTALTLPYGTACRRLSDHWKWWKLHGAILIGESTKCNSNCLKFSVSEESLTLYLDQPNTVSNTVHSRYLAVCSPRAHP